MNLMQRSTLLIFGIAFVALVEDSLSQSDDPNALLARVIALNAGRLSEVVSLEYSARLVYTVLPESRTGQPNEIIYHETEIEFLSKGLLYKIASSQRLSPDGKFDKKVAAFDGVHYQGLRGDELRLTLSKSSYIGEVTFGSNVLFAPYLNLFIPETDSVYTQDYTAMFTSANTWKDLQARLLSTSKLKIVDGELVVSIPVSIPHSRKSMLEVSFSADNGFPDKWLFRDKDGDVYVTGSVDEFFTLSAPSVRAEPFLFPKIMTSVEYRNGKPYGTTKVIIESLKINNQIDDTEFTVDPSTVLNIHDVDSDTVIAVPR